LLQGERLLFVGNDFGALAFVQDFLENRGILVGSRRMPWVMGVGG